MIKHKGKAFVEFISASEIFIRVNQMAIEIEKQYSGENFCLLVVLDGAFVFAADLVRSLSFDSELAFCKYKSYQATESTGELKEILSVPDQLKDKHVVIVEDIVDTGLTLSIIKSKVAQMGVKSVKTAALLFKPSKLKTGQAPDFVGYQIEDKFVIGYGLDFDGFGRQLAAIYQLQS